jgi:hypothetical protein
MRDPPARRSPAAQKSCAFLLSILAGAGSLAAAAELNLDAVAVHLHIGNRDPAVPLHANAFFLEEFGQILEVDPTIVQTLVSFGIDIQIEPVLVGRHIQKRFDILAEQGLAQGGLFLFGGGGHE